jgi:hypothetical protein
MEQPTYLHTCDTCTFLGAYQHLDEVHDLYLCERFLVVVRSDDPEDTFGILASAPNESRSTFPSIVEAQRRAKERGLI